MKPICRTIAMILLIFSLFLLSGCGDGTKEYSSCIDKLCPELKEKIHRYMTSDEIADILDQKYQKVEQLDYMPYYLYSHVYDIGTIGNMTMYLGFSADGEYFNGAISSIGTEDDLDYLCTMLANETEEVKGASHVKLTYTSDREETYSVEKFKELIQTEDYWRYSVKYISFYASPYFASSNYYSEFLHVEQTEDFNYKMTFMLLADYDLAPVDGVSKDSQAQDNNKEENANTQAQENYKKAYENTVILENYTVNSNVTFKKKGLFGGAITIKGDITKTNGVYSGKAVLDMPGNKYTYSYASPYGDVDTWASLNNDKKTIFLPFNVANLGAGIIQPLSEEIIATGVPASSDLNTVQFTVTNDQAYELYGAIINYFKKAAEKSMDISDLTFSSGTITVIIKDGAIKDYKVVLSGKSKAGSITCEFSCTIK